MNPYFEQADHWQDFHTEFLTVLRRNLEAQIGPDYIIQLENTFTSTNCPRNLGDCWDGPTSL